MTFSHAHALFTKIRNAQAKAVKNLVLIIIVTEIQFTMKTAPRMYLVNVLERLLSWKAQDEGRIQILVKDWDDQIPQV